MNRNVPGRPPADNEHVPGPAPRPGAVVTIRYRRPPDREERFAQRLVHHAPDVTVTLLERIRLDREIRIHGRVALEDGSPIVWFTFPGLWHDIGRFHRADGEFTGLYANVLTPVRFIDALTWETTDLFLDVWQETGGRAAVVLDEPELRDAIARGWVEAETADRAWKEAKAIIDAARQGLWPPAVVNAWTLARSRRRIQSTSPPESR